VFDFCERLHGYLAKDVGYWDNEGDFVITTPKSEVQEFISSELQRLFGKKELFSIFPIVMAESRLVSARKHYNKALQFHFSLTDYSQPSVARELFMQ
jgi:hypothetical protein